MEWNGILGTQFAVGAQRGLRVQQGTACIVSLRVHSYQQLLLLVTCYHRSAAACSKASIRLFSG
jgi:hypothetical protein